MVLKAADTISGKEGKAYSKLDNNNEEMYMAKNIEANIEKKKSDVNAIGKRMTGHKATGLNGTGSMTLYYMTPMFRKMIAEYKKTGVDTYFDMVVENADVSSAAGKQTVLLIGVNLDSVVLTKLDADSDDPLEEDIDFTFEDYEILGEFTKI